MCKTTHGNEYAQSYHGPAWAVSSVSATYPTSFSCGWYVACVNCQNDVDQTCPLLFQAGFNSCASYQTYGCFMSCMSSLQCLSTSRQVVGRQTAIYLYDHVWSKGKSFARRFIYGSNSFDLIFYAFHHAGMVKQQHNVQYMPQAAASHRTGVLHHAPH